MLEQNDDPWRTNGLELAWAQDRQAQPMAQVAEQSRASTQGDRRPANKLARIAWAVLATKQPYQTI